MCKGENVSLKFACAALRASGGGGGKSGAAKFTGSGDNSGFSLDKDKETQFQVTR